MTRRPGIALAGALLVGLALLAPARAVEEGHGEGHGAGAAPAATAPVAAAPAAEAARPAAEAARPAEEASLAPFQAVRALQGLQDQVAHGSRAAQAAQAKMLVHVAAVFAEADPAVWKDPRNAGAAALYLFSAGRSGAVRDLIAEGIAFPPESDRLVKGALAYAEGQDEIARALLGKLDPKAQPRGLGGHLALVLATLFADKDPAKATAMLDTARLLVPGTLVEEAALRRQIFLIADTTSIDKFASLSRQYLRRFRGSVFAGNFKARLTSFAVRLAVTGDMAMIGRLDPVLVELPQAERRSLYLTLARNALLSGWPDVARYAAARAAALSPGPAEAERARLYTAAAGAASDGASAARAALSALDAAALPPADGELRDAAVAVAASVDGGLGDHGQDVAGGGPSAGGPTAELIDRAHRAMAAGDALLGSGRTP